MPIACVDIIVEKQSTILMGFRAIEPYRDIWTLPGGRILKGQYPEETVRRILEETGVVAEIAGVAGVFPVMFPRHPFLRYARIWNRKRESCLRIHLAEFTDT
jgi:ADP-ribose pyrophosphatase YjhB (NUDIX family)